MLENIPDKEVVVPLGVVPGESSTGVLLVELAVHHRGREGGFPVPVLDIDLWPFISAEPMGPLPSRRVGSLFRSWGKERGKLADRRIKSIMLKC